MRVFKISTLCLAGAICFQLGSIQAEAGSLTFSGEEGIASVMTEAYNADPEVDEKVARELIPYEGICIAQVNDYVNVRSLPSEEGEVLGKLYNESAGTVEGEEDGWYKITSGSVTGYVKSEYVVIGEEAEALAEEVGSRIATVTTETLRVRSDASTEASILGLIGEGEELTVTDEQDGWVQVSIEEGDGWVSAEFVDLRTDFVEAESKEEEEARLAKEAAAREEGKRKAAAAAQKEQAQAVLGNNAGSGSGNAVVAYASQFVGNPYVYGGTSLTNGADCSGFVQTVFSKFGIKLLRVADDQMHGPTTSYINNSGYKKAVVVDMSSIQPGDLLFYGSGNYASHVAIYMGNGQIVHASNSQPYPKGGIKVSNYNYQTPIKAVRYWS